MKNIFFKKLIIKNFLSVGEEPVCIEFTPGLHIITGINKDKVDRRNGVGKSTVTDALYFALYGGTLRELKKEFIPNNISPGRCEVTLDLQVRDKQVSNDYRIVRLLNPTKCYIYKNGEDCTRDTINNTTEFINNLINTSEDVFQNCVLMSVNNTIPFMAKKRIDKRKFIEGILNLEIFSSMTNTLRNEYNETRRDLETECILHDEVTQTIRNYQEQIQIHNANKQEKLKKYKTRQQDNALELREIKDKIKSICLVDTCEFDKKNTTLKTRLNICNDRITNHSNKIIEAKTNIANCIKQLETLSGTKEQPVCPTCLRVIGDTDKDHIDSEKNKIKNIIKEYKQTIDSEHELLQKHRTTKEVIEQKIQANKENITKITLENQQLNNLQERKQQLEDWQDELRQDLNDLNSQTNQFDKLLAESQSRNTSIEKNIQQIKNKIKDLDIVKFVVSEEGVKSYIVKKILQLLNSKLAYYLKKMDSNCILFFNEYFEEQIVDDKGKICSYFNFSGAERKNIDLACLFTFMDIRRLQGDVCFNVSIYDELFDSSLDEKGVDLVIDILKERLEKYNECMYVISHRKESVNFTTKAEITSGDIIFLQKDNGITTRVAFDREKYKM